MRRPTLLAASLVALMLAPAARAAVSFSPQTTYSVGTTPTAVAVGDFTVNGDPDLVTANFGDGTVSVLVGGAGATFGTAHAYPAGTQPLSMAVGDFNRNGDPDLAAVNNPSGAGGVSVLLGASGAAFGAPTGYAIGNHPQSVAAGYFNGDGDLDLAVTSDAGVSV